MTISRFSKGLTATRLVALASLIGLGVVLAGPQSAQASLIGQTINVNSGLVGGPYIDDVIVVDDPANPELSPGDGSDHDRFFDPILFPGDFYDIQGEQIIINWTGLVDGGITFSNLSWGAAFPDAELTDVVLNLSRELSTDPTLTLLSSSSFFFGFSCSGLPAGSPPGAVPCSDTGFTATLSLVTSHTPGPPPGPQPPGPPPPAVPEPQTLLLFGIGLASLGVLMRRRVGRA